MEPQDPAKDIEGSGYLKRRISSILKAPRKSAICCEPEQQENEVESARPVEKRNSKRVSFAPASDVLLFAKEAKNATPARSPLQELMTASTAAAATQNRVQVSSTEGGNQQILGIENLLNAPLHTSQQRDEVNFDTGDVFEEKTMVFSKEDGVMDMSHCHTINIASDVELLGDVSMQNDAVLAGKNREVRKVDRPTDVFLSRIVNMETGTVSLLTGRSTEPSAEKRNVFSQLPCLDPEYENFLASLSKPCGSSTNTATTRIPLAEPPSAETSSSVCQKKTQSADVDKENQVQKFCNASRKAGESLQRSAFFPEDDVDMTEAQTGHILGVDGGDDDHFQFLFPTRALYAHTDKTASKMMEVKPQESSLTLGSAVPKEKISLINPLLHTPHQRPIVISDPKDDCGEKTKIFTSGNECLDMTQSQTVNIACSSLALVQKSTNSAGPVPVFNDFLTSLSRPSEPSRNPHTVASPTSKATSVSSSSLLHDKTLKPHAGKASWTSHTSIIGSKDDTSMDLTEGQTGRISGLTGSDDPFQFLIPSQDVHPLSESLKKADTTSGQQSSEFRSSHHKASLMVVETSIKPSVKSQLQRQQEELDCEDDHREKTVRFSADDACMDVTKSHTANISTDLKLQLYHNMNVAPSCGEKTVRFTVDDLSMDLTRGLTVNIGSNLMSDLIPSVRKQEGKICGPSQSGPASTHLSDTTFSHPLTSMSKPSDCNVDPAQPSELAICPEDDVSMDITQVHTGRITEILGADDPPQCPLPTGVIDLQSFDLKKTEMTSHQQSSEATDTSKCKVMQTPLQTSLKAKMQKHEVTFQAEDEFREKTVRFKFDDARMDVTRSHTPNIVSHLIQQSHQTVDMPANEEKTVRFTAEDASMDVTRIHTVNIATDLNQLAHQSADVSPANKERTMRFTADDMCIDVTRSYTVNIGADLNALPEENVNLVTANGKKTSKVDAIDVTQSHTLHVSTDLDLLSPEKGATLSTNGEKLIWYKANNETMEVRSGHMVNIATEFEPKPHHNMEFVLKCEERTTRFTENDEAMDMTHGLTINISSSSASGLVLPLRNFPPSQENLNFPVCVKKPDNETSVPHSNRLSLAHGVNQEFDNPQSETREEAADTLHPQETDSNVLVQVKTDKPDVGAENKAPSLLLPVMEKSENKLNYLESSLNMDMTEAQTGCNLEQTCTKDTPQSLFSTQGPSFDYLLKTELTSHNNEALGSSISVAEIKSPPDCLASNETEMTEHEPTPTAYLSQTESSPSIVDKDGKVSCPQKSRRMSLADLQSKVRRLSHIINTAPDAMAIDSYTAPLPQLNQNLNDKTTSLPEGEPELDMVNAQDSTQAKGLEQSELLSATSSATPFSLRRKQLLSRLSVGGFKPKLPQRINPEESKKVTSAGEPTRTVTASVTSQLNNSDDDVSNIYDEELGSFEDVSETLEIKSPDNNFGKKSPSHDMFEPLQENIFEEESVKTVHGQKRPLPEDDSKEDEKRLKASTDCIQLDHQSDAVGFDSNIATTHITTQTIDSSSSSHTASRCEAAFESTLKNSLFESQIEDYTSDAQKKLEDGTITVLEFFKLFNIDFVIHNPRQSMAPRRHVLDTDTKSLDLLKDRHISLPKKLVYEMDMKMLREKVEGLKVRMQDLDKPLKTVNRHLWEEMRHSSEAEIKSFGAKLKEKHNFFKKTGKIQCHEMKVGLYTNLVTAVQEEQQKLRGTIEKADGMIKSLDECICELEMELATIEDKDTEEKPSLKTLQEETKKVTEALADKNRQISELEMQKMQNSSKLNRLKAEMRNMESRINVLNMLNEWKFKEERDNCAVYTFLYETMLLQLVFDKSNDSGSEQKISNITFKLELDDEKSHFHARLVHKLVSQYTEGESAWVDKYPTRGHVPKLLRDVSLVVSRCRLLGEELRLLKMWGGLRLDILDISCIDTRLHIVFSSLKKLSKFEVVFAISLIDQLYVIHVESFKNRFGSITIQQIEDIVASFTPEKKLLTKIVKKIHDTLLS